MKSRHESLIPADIENKISLLLESLIEFPPASKEILITKLLRAMALTNLINDEGLLSFFFKAKIFIWLLHFVLEHKQKNTEDDPDLDQITLLMAELFLVNTKAAMLTSFGGSSLPKQLEHFKTLNELNLYFEKSFNEVFEMYAFKKTKEINVRSNLIQFDFLANKAREKIQPAKELTEQSPPAISPD